MSAKKAPFVAHFRVIPFRGKRFEYIRSMQRIAKLIYAGADGTTGLTGNTNLQVAVPGGGQQQSFSDDQNSGYQNGLAIKPQMGQSPALISIPGFYLTTTGNFQPHDDKQVFYAGANGFFSGAGGAQGYRSNPTATVAAEVKALKAILDGIITAEASGEGVTLFRLEYKGIVWGDRGYTYPE